MDNDIPEDLKAMKSMLEQSLQPPAGEDVPPLPEDLRERLLGQYGPMQSRAAATAKPSFWSALGQLFAQPAFSGALAAVVLLAVIGALSLRPDGAVGEGVDTVRDVAPPAAQAQSIVILYQVEPEQREEFLESGYFDKESVKTTASSAELEELVARPGKSVVIDGAAGEIRGEDGSVRPLPEKAEEVAEVVLEMLG
ncbi:MAG: hypothetical protein Q7Q71_09335 [Verrucomicrobiota bacterium JB023]|nr:hypothetical protein [Verrucomicrobiota bacterium JB023]